jgi:hypothetical protein
MPVVRINFTLDPDLHAKAKIHARKVHFTDFSGLITKLLVEDIRRQEEFEREAIELARSRSKSELDQLLAREDSARSVSSKARRKAS